MIFGHSLSIPGAITIYQLNHEAKLLCEHVKLRISGSMETVRWSQKSELEEGAKVRKTTSVHSEDAIYY